MTGPIGARTNHAVAIMTDDFRLYHELVPLFESVGIYLHGIVPGGTVPTAVEVLLGGPADDERSVPIPSSHETLLVAALVALTTRRGTTVKRVTFGVDPGEAIGLAMVVDGRPIRVQQVFDADAAADLLCSWRDAVQARSMRVHIGDGAPSSGIRLEGILHKRLPGIPVRFVREEATSPDSPATGSRHTDAAIYIALRSP